MLDAKSLGPDADLPGTSTAFVLFVATMPLWFFLMVLCAQLTADNREPRVPDNQSTPDERERNT